MVSHCGFLFNLHLLMVNDLEHIFICLLDISFFLCGRKFLAYIIIKLFVFLLLSFKTHVYIVDRIPLSITCVINILSYSVACFFFVYLVVSFEDERSTTSYSILYHFFHGLCFYIIYKKYKIKKYLPL